MTVVDGNLLAGIDPAAPEEAFLDLLSAPGVTVERIVSTGQSSPPEFWYDQAWAEWILVIAGNAGLRFEDEAAPRSLSTGDYLYIAPGRRHRVAWTAAEQPTIWLAVHIGKV